MNELAELIRSEGRGNLRLLAFMNVVAAVATVAALAVVNGGAQVAAQGDSSQRMLLIFMVSMVLFALSHNYVLLTSAQDIEEMIHRVRVRLFEEVRQTDLPTLEQVGRSALHAALTQDPQTLARTLPMLMIAFQQAVMLLFVGGYLAVLSWTAFLIACGFSTLAVMVRFHHLTSLSDDSVSSKIPERHLFDGLGDLVRGFKEVRMSSERADGLADDLAGFSAQVRRSKSAAKAQWGREFAILQALFYVTIGLMVFVAPLFSPGYFRVAVEATTLALFIVGPVGTLAQVAPMISETETALRNMKELRARLRRYRAAGIDESARPLGRPLDDVALASVTFAYPTDAGENGFAVGPLTARFHAGQITFITGGNGSGKSTMLRLLTGLMPAQGGQVLIGGLPVETEQLQDYRNHISAIFSDVHLSRRLYGVDSSDTARIAALLERLEMTGKVTVANGAFSTVALSTGQRKRLALLVAELEDNPMIVLDEWAADQDPHFRRIFYRELLPELKRRNKIVICVSHDDRYFDVADQILHMNEGRLDSQEVRI